MTNDEMIYKLINDKEYQKLDVLLRHGGDLYKQIDGSDLIYGHTKEEISSMSQSELANLIK